MVLTKSNHFETPQVIECIAMELSANRRYTSKLVLEDTTIVFQKTKGERAEKIKSIHALLRTTRSWKIPAEKQSYKGDPEIIEAPADSVTQVSHLAPYKCRPGVRVQCPPLCSSALLGAASLQVSPQCCLVARELYIAAEELTWPRRAEKQQAWLEADWRLWRNFNCTAGNAAIRAIVIGKAVPRRFT